MTCAVRKMAQSLPEDIATARVLQHTGCDDEVRQTDRLRRHINEVAMNDRDTALIHAELRDILLQLLADIRIAIDSDDFMPGLERSKCMTAVSAAKIKNAAPLWNPLNDEFEGWQ